MKYLKQFAVILAFSLAGEALHFLIPLPVPASIYGMVLLFAALMTGAVKLSAVQETGAFLVEIMPVMFIPAAVGLLEKLDILLPVWWQYLIVIVVSTVLVMAVSGTVTQWVLRRDRKEEPSCRN